MSESNAPPLTPATPSKLNVTFTMPAPPRRKWVKFVMLAMLSVILVLFSMNMFLGAALSVVAGGKGDRLAEELIRKPGDNVKEKIVIFPVEGTVDNDMVDRMRKFCDHVKDDPDVKAVILEINSPGGGITASDEIHHLFENLRGQGKKLIVSMRTLAASGGYYVAMPAEKIYAEKTTLTGSIGVIWPAFEVTGMLKNWGVKPEIIKSTQANDFKDAASPFKEFTEKDREYIRGILNNAHGRFKSIVSAGRAGKLTQPIDAVAVGKIWTSDEALALGLIDGIKYPDEVIAQVCTDIGVMQPKVVKLKPRGGFFDSIGANSALAGGPTKIELHLDPQQVREAMTSKIEFLYTGPTP